MSYPKFDTPKDPEDIADFVLSFTDAIPAGDVIASVDGVDISVVTAGADSAMPDVSVESTLYSGQDVIVWLGAGKAGWRYQISTLVRTVAGRVFRRRALLDVKTQ